MSDPALGIFAGGKPAVLPRFWPELTAALVLLITAAALCDMSLWHDIGWQLWIARQLNAGIPLYGWIMEVNPPLWYWMAQPVDLASAWSGWPATRLLVLAIFALIAASMALTARLVVEWPPLQRAALFAGILASNAIVILPDFGQREQLAFIAAVPYALMISWRVQGRRVPLALAIGVALLATPLFALKHYFVLIPALLELWLIWRLRRNWRPIRPETVILVLGALAYGSAILAFTPDYLIRMVPALAIGYGDLRLHIVLILLNQMNVLLIVCGFYFWHFRHELTPAAQSFILVAAALTLSYYVQFKGWSYQVTPVVGALLLGMVLHVVQRPALPRLRWSEAVTAGLFALLALYPGLVTGPYRNDFGPWSERLLESTRPGMTAVMLTTQAARMWPMVEERHLQWPSRYYHFWMMQTVANQMATGKPLDGPLLDLVNQVRLETVEDFSCNPPDIIIEDRATVSVDDFDLLGVFEQEPRLAAIMASYAVQSTLEPFTVYQRIAPLPAPTGTCRTIAPTR